MKPPPCVVDRWADGSLTRRPKRPFAAGPAPQGGIFRGRPPQTRNVLPKRGLCPQKSNRFGATGVLFGACAPPKMLLRFRAEDLFFYSSFLNLWARTEIRTISFRHALPGNECAPLSKNCAPKGSKRLVSKGRNLG